MIKGNELRINNWVKTHEDSEEQIMNIETYRSSAVVFTDGLFGTLGDLLGIPITEYWLKRFGFEFQKEFDTGWYMVETADEYVGSIRVWSNKNGWFLSPNPDYSKKIEFVHQLQNLFFAVTDEELTTKDYAESH